jgi:pectate lyase
MGACVKVEKNYFENTGTAVMMRYSPVPGAVELVDNHFGSSDYSITPGCVLDVPYEYHNILDDTEDIPALVGSIVGVNDLKQLPHHYSLENYPNPFNPATTIKYSLPAAGYVKIEICNSIGQKIETLVNEYLKAGTYKIEFDASRLNSGIYIYSLLHNGNIKSNKMMLIK